VARLNPYLGGLERIRQMMLDLVDAELVGHSRAAGARR
jgi:hypothetical protein